MPQGLPLEERIKIEEIARGMRATLERMIDLARYNEGTTGSPVSGSCLYASILLQTSLEKFAHCRVDLCGGAGDGITGIVCPDGQMRGHYWVQGTSASGARFLCDITADQFGLPDIVLLDEAQSWIAYRSEPLDDVRAQAGAVLHDLHEDIAEMAQKNKAAGKEGGGDAQ